LELATRLVQRLGGAANLQRLEACLNRVRATVADPALVDVPGLKAIGAYGVVISGWVVQVVIGANADSLVDGARLVMAQEPGSAIESAPAEADALTS
jgi:PTS system N-acetylglucosamine-specific IIB component